MPAPPAAVSGVRGYGNDSRGSTAASTQSVTRNPPASPHTNMAQICRAKIRSRINSSARVVN